MSEVPLYVLAGTVVSSSSFLLSILELSDSIIHASNDGPRLSAQTRLSAHALCDGVPFRRRLTSELRAGRQAVSPDTSSIPNTQA